MRERLGRRGRAAWLAAAILGTAGAGAVTGGAGRAAAGPEPDRPQREWQAPELVGDDWFNKPGGKPVRLADRLGKVTIVHFWTYG